MSKHSYSLSDFDFNLPEELTAVYPSPRREDSRLFVIDEHDKFHHSSFASIGNYLQAGDLLVINNTRVIPARLIFKRISGGRVEIILTRKIHSRGWLVITNRSARIRTGEVLVLDKNSDLSMTIIQRQGEFFEVETSREFTDEVLSHYGEIPLPPYIKRPADEMDSERYQTVYASRPGAAAAPTAGLHFTSELIGNLRESGIRFAEITLEVSWGTFSPVRDEDLSKHSMHGELYEIPEESATMINETRAAGRRIVAVGTTSLRVLESTYHNGENKAGKGETNIFLYPPYSVKSADCLVTNFHTPGSTLLMLVSAFVGYDTIMSAYRTAIEMQYRFFSYGDAMLIIRKGRE